MKKQSDNRIHHPWHLWEDYKHNFYGGVLEYKKDGVLETYASLLRDLNQFEEAMKIIISEWKFSCEHNLTNDAMNRIAWLGQASAALVHNIPHNVGMGGYNLLTIEEQQAADNLAGKYLNLWMENNVNTQKIS